MTNPETTACIPPGAQAACAPGPAAGVAGPEYGGNPAELQTGSRVHQAETQTQDEEAELIYGCSAHRAAVRPVKHAPDLDLSFGGPVTKGLNQAALLIFHLLTKQHELMKSCEHSGLSGKNAC